MERPMWSTSPGLSVISIEQKQLAGIQAISTVGTITEIYDLFRLLYARIGEAYGARSGKKWFVTVKQVIDHILSLYNDQMVAIPAPIVRGRKGHYHGEISNKPVNKDILK